MGDDRRYITLKGFLREFGDQHVRRPDRPFCFLLGAGASKSSGIPTGQEMAGTWLNEIHERENHDRMELEDSATAERLEIEGFALGRAGGCGNLAAVQAVIAILAAFGQSSPPSGVPRPADARAHATAPGDGRVWRSRTLAKQPPARRSLAATQ